MSTRRMLILGALLLGFGIGQGSSLLASEMDEAAAGRDAPSSGLVVPPPAGSTVIGFDEPSAPCFFGLAFPLRDAYAARGVTFSGPGGQGGGTILHRCSGLDPQGSSPPNVLS